MPRQQQYPSRFPVLKTARLILRRLDMNDAPEIFKLRSDDHVNQYIDRPKAIALNDAADFINKIETGVNNNGWLYWAISQKDDNKLIGTICLWNIDKENARAEAGYELLPGFQGKGLMLEAFARILDYGFKILQLTAITAYTHSSNQRSIRLLEKSNFSRDKVLEEEYYRNEPLAKEVIYSLKSPIRGPG